MRPRLLVVDDDPDVRDSLRRALGYAGYSVTTAANGLDALSSLSRSPADLVILDVLMPMLDGLDTCRALRDRGSAAPVLVLTARDSVDDRVAGLDSGADDYLTKPFDFKELLARLRALSRRITQIRPGVLQVADLTLNPENHGISRAGKRISVTAKEYALLEFLMMNQNRVVNREQIAQHDASAGGNAGRQHARRRPGRARGAHLRKLRRPRPAANPSSPRRPSSCSTGHLPTLSLRGRSLSVGLRRGPVKRCSRIE